MSTVAHAFDYEVDGVYYNVKGNGEYLEVVDYIPNKQTAYRYKGDVKVPSSVMIADLGKSLPVKSVGANAFASCSELNSVDLSATSITSLPEYAFGGSYSLMRVYLPASLKKIGAECFYNCRALTRIDLPEALEEIGEYAFAETGLTEISVPDNVLTIGDMAFSACPQLKRSLWVIL